MLPRERVGPESNLAMTPAYAPSVARNEESGLVAERLLQVIDEGRRTATYKLALVLALIDACAERAGADAVLPSELSTREVAEHVVRIYFPQVKAYSAKSDSSPLHEEPAVLRQLSSAGSTAVTIAAVTEFRRKAPRTNSALAARVVAAQAYEDCIDRVEVNFAQFPIRRLQIVGGQQVPFLYEEVEGGETVSLKRLHEPGSGTLRLCEGVAKELLRLSSLIRPLVELHWVRQIAEWNQLDLEMDQLWGHLFGESRVTFPSQIREYLWQRDAKSCFYCGTRISLDEVQVDHVIPWSRWPNNAIENLVASDARCNASKNDNLLGCAQVERWVQSLRANAAEMGSVARAARWESDLGRTLALARTAYEVVPIGTPLWVGVDHMETEGVEQVRNLLRSGI